MWGRSVVMVAAVLATAPGPAASRAASAAPITLGAPTSHLVVIVMENKGFREVVGSPAAPYLNDTLIPSSELHTDYHAVAHPSLPNYLTLTSGSTQGCGSDSCSTGIRADNLFHQMDVAASPIDWRAYMGSMRSNCSATTGGAYYRWHNPPIYFDDLGPHGTASCATNDVPFSRLRSDLAAGTLASFSWVSPNIYKDMHSPRPDGACHSSSATQTEICQGDRWLSVNVPAILSDGGRDDVTVVVVFDEGSTVTGGGGRVMLTVTGPGTCAGCTVVGSSDHVDLLHAIEDRYGLSQLTP